MRRVVTGKRAGSIIHHNKTNMNNILEVLDKPIQRPAIVRGREVLRTIKSPKTLEEYNLYLDTTGESESCKRTARQYAIAKGYFDT